MDQNLKPSEKKIIALVGLMGAGKTTIGGKLAERLGIYFIDSDNEIEDQEQRSIAQIFDVDGENYFRKIESKIIKEIINRDEPIVLSLGGGALMDKEIQELIKEKTVSIWLYADIETTLHRVSGRNTRPLINSGDKRTILSDLTNKRYPIYKQANIHIDTSRENHHNIIDNVLNQIGKLVGKND